VNAFKTVAVALGITLARAGVLTARARPGGRPPPATTNTHPPPSLRGAVAAS
jgi:hypothetical protein